MATAATAASGEAATATAATAATAVTEGAAPVDAKQAPVDVAAKDPIAAALVATPFTGTEAVARLEALSASADIRSFLSAFDAATTPDTLCEVLDGAARNPAVAENLSRDDMIARARDKRAALAAGAAATAAGSGGDGIAGWTRDVAIAFGHLLSLSMLKPVLAAAAEAEAVRRVGGDPATAPKDATVGKEEETPAEFEDLYRWDPMFVTNTIDITEEGCLATSKRGPGAVLAAPLPNTGVHRWRVRIETGSGNCLTVGFGRQEQSGSTASQHNVSGLHAGGSIIETFHGGRKTTSQEWRPQSGQGGYKLLTGTIVQCEVDMDKRTLRMWVDDRPTGVVIDSVPADVCPAVSLRQTGHAARLLGAADLPPPSAAVTPVLRPPRLQRMLS